MTTKVTLVRNPYPVPDISREGNWVPNEPYLGQNVSTRDRNWQARLQPHERLFAHHTLNSVRKDCRLFRPQVPVDSLDYALSSVYEHCKDTFVPKMYTFIQPESLGKETWRVLRNQIKTYTKPPAALGHPLRHATGQVEPTVKQTRIQNDYTLSTTSHTRPATSYTSHRKEESESHIAKRMREGMQKIHPSSLKLTIDGPHIDQTNAGYSRKIDGTFYNI